MLCPIRPGRGRGILSPRIREYVILGVGVFIAVIPGVILFPHYVGDPAKTADITLVQIAFVPLYIAVSLFFKSRMPDSAMPSLFRFSALSAATSVISWAIIALTPNDSFPWPVPNIVAPIFDFRGPNALQAQRFELWCEFWVVLFLVLCTANWAVRVYFMRSAPDPDRQ